MNHYQGQHPLNHPNTQPISAPKSSTQDTPATPPPIPVADPSPYPEISISNKNLRCAQLLSHDFAAPKSEMSTLNQYVYESWVLQADFPEMAAVIKRIAVVEMHHLYMLGELITKLGGRPRLQASRPDRQVVWNANMIYYAEKPKQLMRYNIMIEQKAIQTYTAHQRMISDPCVTDVLARIILDEQVHVHIFEKFLAEMNG